MKAKMLFFSVVVSFYIPLVGMGGMYVPLNNNYGYGSSNYNNSYSGSSYFYRDKAEYCLKETRKKINKNCKLADIEGFVKSKKFGNALSFVIRQESSDLCAQLLEMGADPDGSEDKKGEPLRGAMVCRKPSRMVELLLKHEATITDFSPQGNTLLLCTMICAYNNRVARNTPIANGAILERLHYVLAHKDSMPLINCKDKEGNTALGWAVRDLADRISGNLDTKEAIAIVDLLLAHGENPDLAIHKQILLNPNEIIMNICLQIEKSDYAPFMRYIPKRHQQFKNDCSDRLANYLMKLIPHAEGPSSQLPFEMILKIAKQRWDCDED